MQKTALVTGASRGLGAGFVEYLSKEGYKVFAGMRDISNAKSTENYIPVNLDVSDDQSIDQAYAVVASQTEKIDLIINNAGLNKESATNDNKELVCNIDKLDRASLLKMFDVNSISQILVVKKFLPLITGSPSFIINISSCRASFHDEFTNSNANYGYRASKIALNMMTFASLKDLPKNVRTFAVHPGSVKTDMNPGGTETPEGAAKSIIAITRNWKDDYNGKFMRYSGELYPL